MTSVPKLVSFIIWYRIDDLKRSENLGNYIWKTENVNLLLCFTKIAERIVETEKVIEVEKVVEVEKIVEKIVEVIKPCLKCLESCKECAKKDEKLVEQEKMKERLLFDLNYMKESYDVTFFLV